MRKQKNPPWRRKMSYGLKSKNLHTSCTNHKIQMRLSYTLSFYATSFSLPFQMHIGEVSVHEQTVPLPVPDSSQDLKVSSAPSFFNISIEGSVSTRPKNPHQLYKMSLMSGSGAARLVANMYLMPVHRLYVWLRRISIKSSKNRAPLPTQLRSN